MAGKTDRVKSWPVAGKVLIDTLNLGICLSLRILECFPVPCTFVLPRFSISAKVERLMSTVDEREEHLLEENSPTLPMVIIITTVAVEMTISPIFMVTKSFSRKRG